MMRTIEVIIVIVILTGAFVAVSAYTVLPTPKQVSPTNLDRLALSTLQELDSKYDLSSAAFQTNNATLWGALQVSLSASLPPNAIYNLTVYNVTSPTNGAPLYNTLASISNAGNLGSGSGSSSYVVASSNVTFNLTPQRIGTIGGGGTLYILNASDAPGWWITGYTANTLAQDLYTLLSPYFLATVMIQNTAQLGQILNGSAIQGETVQDAVVINTCGEAVPIPSGYYSSSGVGFNPGDGNYAKYSYTLGTKVRTYNWTWVSIVGYPLYYVSNTGLFANIQNNWGIFGMNMTGPPGLNAFLQGLDGQNYTQSGSGLCEDLTNPGTTLTNGTVSLSNYALDRSNYYGIYPAPYQTSTRALNPSIVSTYHLTVTTYILNPTADKNGNWYPGTVYRHTSGSDFQGGFMALGLTRTPDIRVTALGLLCEYKPQLYGSDYTSSGVSRLVVLQLGLAGGA